MTDDDLKTLAGLLEANNTFFKTLFAMMFPYTFSGAICVGPSGAGKTSIQNFFSEDRLVPPTESTYKRFSNPVRYGAWTYQMTDTPGQHRFAEHRGEAFTAIRQGKEKVLMLVFSAGFLKTLGIIDASGSEIKYKRPDRDPKGSLEEYLSDAIDEELDWMRTVKQQVPSLENNRFTYVMVIVNKLDQWYDTRNYVAAFYEGRLLPEDDQQNNNSLTKHLNSERSKEFKKLLGEIVNNWCIQGVNPTHHYVASQYDSLYGNAPSGEMSIEAAELSLRLLRAQVRARFLGG